MGGSNLVSDSLPDFEGGFNEAFEMFGLQCVISSKMAALSVQFFPFRGVTPLEGDEALLSNFVDGRSQAA